MAIDYSPQPYSFDTSMLEADIDKLFTQMQEVEALKDLHAEQLVRNRKYIMIAAAVLVTAIAISAIIRVVKVYAQEIKNSLLFKDMLAKERLWMENIDIDGLDRLGLERGRDSEFKKLIDSQIRYIKDLQNNHYKVYFHPERESIQRHIGIVKHSLASIKTDAEESLREKIVDFMEKELDLYDIGTDLEIRELKSSLDDLVKSEKDKDIEDIEGIKGLVGFADKANTIMSNRRNDNLDKMKAAANDILFNQSTSRLKVSYLFVRGKLKDNPRFYGLQDKLKYIHCQRMELNGKFCNNPSARDRYVKALDLLNEEVQKMAVLIKEYEGFEQALKHVKDAEGHYLSSWIQIKVKRQEVMESPLLELKELARNIKVANQERKLYNYFQVTFEGECSAGHLGLVPEYFNLLFTSLVDGREIYKIQDADLIADIRIVFNSFIRQSSLKIGRCLPEEFFELLCENTIEELNELEKKKFTPDDFIVPSSPESRILRRLIALKSTGEQANDNCLLKFFVEGGDDSLYSEEVHELFAFDDEYSSDSARTKEYQDGVRQKIVNRFSREIKEVLPFLIGMRGNDLEYAKEWVSEGFYRQDRQKRLNFLLDNLYLRGAKNVALSLQGEFDRVKLCQSISFENDRYPGSKQKSLWIKEFLLKDATEKEVENFLVFVTSSSTNPKEGIKIVFNASEDPWMQAATCAKQIALRGNFLKDRDDTKELFYKCIRESIHPSQRVFGWG